MDYDSYIGDCIKESVRLKSTLFGRIKEIEQIAEKIIDSYKNKGKVLICGNGGSAADSQHIATELVNMYKISNRKSLSALALPTDIVQSTAWANDHGSSAEYGFSRQVEAYARTGDILWGISTSGNAQNIYRAFEKGRELGTYNFALTGEGGGKLKGLSDLCFEIPSKDTPRIQEAHELVYHIICDLIEKKMFGKE
jgi:D-sedoheptulose 7-phosphate isomerase